MRTKRRARQEDHDRGWSGQRGTPAFPPAWRPEPRGRADEDWVAISATDDGRERDPGRVLVYPRCRMAPGSVPGTTGDAVPGSDRQPGDLFGESLATERRHPDRR